MNSYTTSDGKTFPPTRNGSNDMMDWWEKPENRGKDFEAYTWAQRVLDACFDKAWELFDEHWGDDKEIDA